LGVFAETAADGSASRPQKTVNSEQLIMNNYFSRFVPP
jgi:hypothetical protein